MQTIFWLLSTFKKPTKQLHAGGKDTNNKVHFHSSQQEALAW